MILNSIKIRNTWARDDYGRTRKICLPFKNINHWVASLVWNAGREISVPSTSCDPSNLLFCRVAFFGGIVKILVRLRHQNKMAGNRYHCLFVRQSCGHFGPWSFRPIISNRTTEKRSPKGVTLKFKSRVILIWFLYGGTSEFRGNPNFGVTFSTLE